MQDHSSQSDPDSILSSVRRIVSRDEGYTDAEPVSEKLLLTPSLRVDPNVTDAELADIPMPSRDRLANRVQTRTLTSERQSLEQRIAELERAVSTVDQEWEPDGSEDSSVEQPSALNIRPRKTPAGSESAGGSDASSDVDRAGDAPDRSARPAVTRNRFAPQHVPEETGNTPSAPGDNVRPLHERTPEPPKAAQELPHLRAVPSDTAAAGTPPTPESDNEMGLPGKDDGPEENAFTELSDELDFDEEALRDLVAEVVRSELQGELGERITRNVRKLVRREIHRALMTRDFR